jgi:hypothetical protein
LDALEPQLLSPQLAAHGGRALCDIGAVCGLDVLLNNSDRLPLLWDNGGNAANLMILRSTQHIETEIVAIDQACFPVGAGGEAAFLADVRQLCAELLSPDSISEPSLLGQMCERLRTEVAVELLPEGASTDEAAAAVCIGQLAQGMRRAFTAAACLCEDELRALRQTVQSLGSEEGDAWGSVWEDRCGPLPIVLGLSPTFSGRGAR